MAQIWRRRPLGEIANATTTRSSMSLLMRQARGDRTPMPPEFIDTIWRHWDKGTQRATLHLYRDANPDRLAAAGANLSDLTCPALILWGDRDPYLPTKFAHDHARTLPNAEVKQLQGAGHWPWIDDPTVVDQVLNFLG